MVGPVTEEFAFRACMLPLLLLQVCTPLPHAYAGQFGRAGLALLHDAETGRFIRTENLAAEA